MGQGNFIKIIPELLILMQISDYILQSKETRKGIGDVMGGKILELESERLLRIGKKYGINAVIHCKENENNI